ncbi:MAG TPA: enoyl-CoA hydratase/isomerase family protein [Pseudonocardia sp.]|nr:enoyl-CoA hydratase/isomerase family protein [Pseudonocardia sp.]
MIERDDDGEVAVLRLAHGPVNAMDLELCRAASQQLRGLAADPARAVVLTGTGRAFSAGVDLRRYLEQGEPYVAQFLPALVELFSAAFELPKPLVAAVNGHAIAGGCVLAACADITLMADGNGRVGVPELKVGVPFPRVALEVLRHAVGEVAARRLVFGAGTHDAAAAREIGLVDEVVPAGELLDRAIGTARALAVEIPADSFAITKGQLRREARERIARGADEEQPVTQLWNRRAADGWTANYLKAVTGK